MWYIYKYMLFLTYNYYITKIGSFIFKLYKQEEAKEKGKIKKKTQ